MSIIYAPGVTSKSVFVQIVDDSGLPVTSLVAATFPSLTYWIAGANAAVAFPSLTDLSTITTAFSAGGVKELSGGGYRLDCPDAMWSSAGKVKIIGEASGKHVLCEVVDVSYPQVDVRQLLGTAWLTPGVAGTPDVNVKTVGAVNQSGGDLYAAVTNIGVTTAALNATAASATYTTGSDTGGFANTATLDGVYDSVTDTAGTVDFYYQFSLGSTGQTGVGVNWIGYVVGVANTVKAYAYNWGNSAWDQIGSVVGITGTMNGTQDWELTSAHTGTGGNLGLVRIRFSATGLVTSTTKTDRILCGYVNVQAFPTNFAAQSIDASGRVDIGKALGTAVTLDSNNVLNVSAKYLGGTLQTGADVGSLATEINADTDELITSVAAIPTTPLLAANVPANFAVLGITAGGKISEVVLTDTVTTYTGNTPQTGDAYAQTIDGTHGLSVLYILLNSLQTGLIVTSGNLAQTGSTSSSIKLNSAESATNSFYVDCWVRIYSGTGTGQAPRRITAYTGATRVAAVTPNWNTTPDATSVYTIVGIAAVDVGAINNVSTSPVTAVKAIQGLTTADTIATYTGNTPQTGDAYAAIESSAVLNPWTPASLGADLALWIEGATVKAGGITLSGVGSPPPTVDSSGRVLFSGSNSYSMSGAIDIPDMQSFTIYAVGTRVPNSNWYVLNHSGGSGAMGITNANLVAFHIGDDDPQAATYIGSNLILARWRQINLTVSSNDGKFTGSGLSGIDLDLSNVVGAPQFDQIGTPMDAGNNLAALLIVESDTVADGTDALIQSYLLKRFAGPGTDVLGSYIQNDAAGTTTLLSRLSSTLTTALATLAGHDPGATLASRTNITAASGVALSATGLDAIAVTDPGAPASQTTLAKMIVGIWRRLYKKATLTATTWTLFKDDGTTPNSSSTVSDDGTTQTQGPFS
jgi:hypothetical protein